jgi:DNA-binding NarL/FixJ family response regulator
LDGRGATEQLTATKHLARVLVLWMRTDEKDVRASARSGAKGDLIKNCSRDELVNGIHSVYAGHFAASPMIASYFSSVGHDSRGLKVL